MQRWSKVYAIGMVLVVWFVLHGVLDAFIVPSPVAVGRFLVVDLERSRLVRHLAASLLRILAAVGGSVLVGGSLGILSGSMPVVDRLLAPIVYLFYPVPRVAFLPVFLLLLGLGEASKIWLMIAVAGFYIWIPVRDAIVELPEMYVLMARQFMFTRRMWVVEVVLPAVAPAFFTALKLTLGTSMATLFFAENYATQYGIGYYIMNSWFKSDYVGMYAGIVALSVLGNLLFGMVNWVQLRVVKWER